MSQRVPVLIGVGQQVVREVDPQVPPSPLSLAAQACQSAVEDCAASAGHEALTDQIDTLAFVRLNSDSIPGRSGPFGVYGNLPTAPSCFTDIQIANLRISLCVQQRGLSRWHSYRD